MSKHLFANHKAALAFAGITLVSVGFMIGPEDDEGMLARTVETIEARGDSGDAVLGDAPRAGTGTGLFGGSGAPVVRGNEPSGATAPDRGGAAFASDDDLVDPASGFDPVPAIDLGNRPDAPSDGTIVEPDETIILPPNVQQQLEL